jgi:hypothetical protein
MATTYTGRCIAEIQKYQDKQRFAANFDIAVVRDCCDIPVVRDRFRELFPWKNASGQWHCNHCGEIVTCSHIGFHHCSGNKQKSHALEIPTQYVGSIAVCRKDTGNCCKLCGQRISLSKPHKCSSVMFKSFIYDISELCNLNSE